MPPLHEVRRQNRGAVRFLQRPEPERCQFLSKVWSSSWSMDLIEDLDPEEARAIVDPALKLMIEAVQR